MKIIKLSGLRDIERTKVDILPDSALQKNGKPFFIPDFSEEFAFKAVIAAHVCRLGKNIAKKFASRYYNEVGLCLAFEAVDLLSDLREKKYPWALATAFDSSVIVGDFYPVDGLNLDNAEISVEIGGQECSGFSVEAVGDLIDTAIEFTSQYFTLKIGDYILLDCGGMPVKACINNHVTANLFGKKSIDIRIK